MSRSVHVCSPCPPHRVLRVLALCSSLAAMLLLGESPAGAQGVSKMVGFSVWGIGTSYWGDGAGIGARYMIPLGNEGVLPPGRVRDRFALEFGADFLNWSERWHIHRDYYDYSFSALMPVCGVLWGVWVTPKVALYPKVDLSYVIGWYRDWDHDWGHEPDADYEGFNIEGAAGIMVRLSGVALRAEVGSHMIKAGVGFGF